MISDMDQTTLELIVPSKLGNEKFAMEFAEDVAVEMGFSREKIENLKIAVSEACLNSIEHGNKENKNKKVKIYFTLSKFRLEITIHDEGKSFVPKSIEKPSLKDIIEGKDIKKRGWGMSIIKDMVDEMEYLDGEDGTHLKMVVRLQKETKDADL
jgi:serine/threonine-protein kinase RsbW